MQANFQSCIVQARSGFPCIILLAMMCGVVKLTRHTFPASFRRTTTMTSPFNEQFFHNGYRCQV